MRTVAGRDAAARRADGVPDAQREAGVHDRGGRRATARAASSGSRARNICGDPNGCAGTCAPPGLSWHQLGAADRHHPGGAGRPEDPAGARGRRLVPVRARHGSGALLVRRVPLKRLGRRGQERRLQATASGDAAGCAVGPLDRQSVGRPTPRCHPRGCVASNPRACSIIVASSLRLPDRQITTIGRSWERSPPAPSMMSFSGMWIAPSTRPASHSYCSRQSTSWMSVELVVGALRRAEVAHGRCTA